MIKRYTNRRNTLLYSMSGSTCALYICGRISRPSISFSAHAKQFVPCRIISQLYGWSCNYYSISR